MRKFDRTQNQRGIGLLELMLAMVIIAILTLMSIQYFSSSKRNTETGKAVDEIQDILGIVSSFPAPYKSQSTTPLDQMVVMSGQLPEEYVYKNGTTYYVGSPWSNESGDITTTNFGLLMVDSNTLKITGGSALPNWACQSVLDRFRSTVVTDDDDKKSTCDDGLVLYFYMKSNQNL